MFVRANIKPIFGIGLNRDRSSTELCNCYVYGYIVKIVFYIHIQHSPMLMVKNNKVIHL